MTAAVLRTDGLQDRGTFLETQFGMIDVDQSGSNELVAAVPGKRIRVVSYNLTADDAVVATFLSAAVEITGGKSMAANGHLPVPFSPLGHFQTAAGAALNLSLSGAVQVGGEFAYVLV